MQVQAGYLTAFSSCLTVLLFRGFVPPLDWRARSAKGRIWANKGKAERWFFHIRTGNKRKASTTLVFRPSNLFGISSACRGWRLHLRTCQPEEIH